MIVLAADKYKFVMKYGTLDSCCLFVFRSVVWLQLLVADMSCIC